MNENEEVASGKVIMDAEIFLFTLKGEWRRGRGEGIEIGEKIGFEKGKEVGIEIGIGKAQSQWEIYTKDLANRIRNQTAKEIINFLEHEFCFDQDGMVVINKHGILKEIKKRYGV